MPEGLHNILSMDDTVAAISTPAGRSGIGVVRISGRQSLPIAARFFDSSSEPEHRKAIPGSWLDERGECIDAVVVTLFRSPHSYTGEDLIEISAHGNPLILGRIVACAQRAGARLAAPGEFTFRAVSNGKMDLLQAEAVREFIDAQTEQQARTALRQMEGSLSRRIRPAKEKLLDRIARLEAGIDFAEDDVAIPEDAVITADLEALIKTLEEVEQTFGYGRILSGGLRIVILGKPNVGKSSLFNRLVAAERSIVTEIPGTTRDVLTETVSLDGVPLRFADTAGVRETNDTVESMGVARALEMLSDADLALVVLDGSCELDSNDRQVLSRVRSVSHLIIVNKVDLPQAIAPDAVNGAPVVRVSAKTAEGFDGLRDAIRGFLLDRKAGAADDCVVTTARQHAAIVRTIRALGAGTEAVRQGVPHEMVLLDLYEALAALGELTGEVVAEDILDRIFSTFCIGK